MEEPLAVPLGPGQPLAVQESLAPLDPQESLVPLAPQQPLAPLAPQQPLAPLAPQQPLAPLALYRRYRPETFAEVIGQDHVTQPLRHALAGNRVHHAYLFSGPRGCGKTTSARILARTLNCERAPVAEPCGACQSCRDLARGGPGSLDVIEIDAASHGGVDDARDLRERAFFAPVSSRYKVYVIDEAHMVSTQGFNALLKLVEEPPPHLKFIFATTEPDKVIGTIRSRTHHYPFRLVPPRLLTTYLSELCEREGVRVESSALPLVVRAGGGSVRDTLSVLDQLIGGAGDGGVTYALAAGLLGYTPDWLLDEVVDAFAAGDGASVFGAVDKVVETGQDPRRFAEDLLQRLRDLIIVASVPDAVGSGVLQASADLAERLEGQAARFGVADLTRSAEVVSAGLDEIRGATAPRLLLELICARLLLPGADASVAGVQARLDRLERRVAISGEVMPGVAGGPPPAIGREIGHQPETVQEPPAPEQSPQPRRESAEGRPALDRTSAAHPETSPGGAVPSSVQSTPTAQPTAAPTADPAPVPTAESTREPIRTPAATPNGPPTTTAEPVTAPDATTDRSAASHRGVGAPAAAGGLGLAEVRHAWPDVLAHLSGLRRLAWMLLSRDSHVVSVDAATVTVSLPNAGARDSFARCGGEELLRQSIIDVLGEDWTVEAVVGPGPGTVPAPPSSSAGPSPSAQTETPNSSAAPTEVPARTQDGAERPPPPPQATSGRDRPTASADTAWPDPARLGGGAASPRAEDGQAPVEAPPAAAGPTPSGAPSGVSSDATDGTLSDAPSGASSDSPQGAPTGAPSEPPGGPRRSSQARAAIRPTRTTGGAGGPAAARGASDAEAHPDDPDVADDGVSGAELLVSRLGAQVIEEIPHEP